jgi:hypothetical protein
VICETKCIWSHYLLFDPKKSLRTLHCRYARGPGRFNRLMRLCPSIHTFSHERIPSGRSGERAITSRPLVRPSGRTCESNHYPALSNRLPCPVGLVGSPHNSRRRLTGFVNRLLGGDLSRAGRFSKAPWRRGRTMNVAGGRD